MVRDFDGAERAVERRGPTKAAAERALKAALRDRAPVGAGGDITADSQVSTRAEAWDAGLADLSPVTMQAYRDRLDRRFCRAWVSCGSVSSPSASATGICG